MCPSSLRETQIGSPAERVDFFELLEWPVDCSVILQIPEVEQPDFVESGQSCVEEGGFLPLRYQHDAVA